MAVNVCAWMSSLIMPGLIVFDIEWGVDHQLNTSLLGMLGLVCKLNYCETENITSVAAESVRKIENAIVVWGLDSEVLQWNGSHDPDDFSLNRVNVRQTYKVRLINFKYLQTDTFGLGWMTGKCRERPTDDPGANVHQNIEMRRE